MKKLLILSLVFISLISSLGCTLPEVARSIQLINVERESRGIAPVVDHPQLRLKAQQWAEIMADNGKIAHSNLAEGTTGWRALGENVAMNFSVEGAANALMDSPGHRRNILNRAYTHVGVGAAWHGDRLYVVQVFGG